MNGIAPSLDEVLDPAFLRMVFQPLVTMTAGRPIVRGVEGLVRGPDDSLFHSAGLICDFVRRKRAEYPFDRACARLALSHAGEIPGDLVINVNVHAATLHHDPGFVDFLATEAANAAVPLRLLAVEVVEHAPNWADYKLDRSLARLRALGIAIALDDVGAGHSTLRMMLDMRPDHFKVDRHFVDGCADDPGRQAVLAAIVELAHRFGAAVTAEGIENARDLVAALATGITSFQGYLFSMPLPPKSLGPAVAKLNSFPTI